MLWAGPDTGDNSDDKPRAGAALIPRISPAVQYPPQSSHRASDLWIPVRLFSVAQMFRDALVGHVRVTLDGHDG
jgi:hypothetical protein